VPKVSLQNSAGSHRHASLEQYARSHGDLYTTPVEAVQRLYQARPYLRSKVAWDSSAGLGHIVKAIRDMGCQAYGTELHDHPFPKVAPISTGVDLFDIEDAYCDVCVVNPPFNEADRHIRHMSAMERDVWALLRFNWICAKKRDDMLHKLREILIVGRVGMLPPGVVDKGMQPTVDFAWFKFEPGNRMGAGIQVERI